MMLSGRTILVVEDEIIVAFALEDILSELGANVVIASTIDQAHDAIGAATDLALALLDVNVNGVKSYSLASELRNRAVPVVFATGYGDAEHPLEFVDAPTVTKPYTALQIAHAIASALPPARL